MYTQGGIPGYTQGSIQQGIPGYTQGGTPRYTQGGTLRYTQGSIYTGRYTSVGRHIHREVYLSREAPESLLTVIPAMRGSREPLNGVIPAMGGSREPLRVLFPLWEAPESLFLSLISGYSAPESLFVGGFSLRGGSREPPFTRFTVGHMPSLPGYAHLSTLCRKEGPCAPTRPPRGGLPVSLLADSWISHGPPWYMPTLPPWGICLLPASQ